MQEREVFVDDYHFNGKMVPAAAASVVDGPWALTDTSAAGAPTMSASNGEMIGTLANTNEVENLCLSFGDVLPYDIDDLKMVEIWFRAICTTNGSIAVGLSSARNDTLDSVAAHAWWRLDGASNALKVETDDGVNDNDDVDTGIILPSTRSSKLIIDFAGGVQTVGPPSSSKGGKGAVLFYAENARGQLVRVCKNTAFDMSNYAGKFQLLMQIQKTASTDQTQALLRRIRVTHQTAA